MTDRSDKGADSRQSRPTIARGRPRETPDDRAVASAPAKTCAAPYVRIHTDRMLEPERLPARTLGQSKLSLALRSGRWKSRPAHRGPVARGEAPAARAFGPPTGRLGPN